MVSSPSTCPTWITNNGKHSEAMTNDQNRQTSMDTLDTISKLNCQYLSGDRRRLTRDKYQKCLRDQGEWLEENMTPLCYSRYESCDARRNNSVANSRGEGPDTKPKVPFWLAAQKDAHTYVPKRHRIMGVHTSNLKGRKSSTVQSHSLQPLSRENDCDFLNHNLPFRGSRRKRMHSKVTSLPPVHVDAMMFMRRHTKNSDRASNDEEKLNQAIFGESKPIRVACQSQSLPQETIIDKCAMNPYLPRRSSRFFRQRKSNFKGSTNTGSFTDVLGDSNSLSKRDVSQLTHWHTVEDAQTGTGWQKGSKGLPPVSSIHSFEETALEFNDRSNKQNNTPSRLQNEIEDAMLHAANPKTRANRHSIKIEDALMLDEELDHEGRFSLPVSRSFSAKEAVAFQEASEPQPWQDISQILHTHTISRKESNQNVRPRQSQFAACEHSFLKEQKDMFPGLKVANDLPVDNINQGCAQKMCSRVTDDPRMLYKPARSSPRTCSLYSTIHTYDYLQGYCPQQLETVKDTRKRTVIPQMDFEAVSDTQANSRKISSRRSQQRYSRAWNPTTCEDNINLATREEAIQETQCHVEHKEGNEDDIKPKCSALVPGNHSSEESLNVESGTNEKRRSSWQTKLRRWSRRSSGHAEKRNPWNDSLVSKSELHPVKESDDDTFEIELDLEELRERQWFLKRRKGVCIELEKTMNLVKLNGATMSLFDLRQDICNLVDDGIFKNIHDGKKVG